MMRNDYDATAKNQSNYYVHCPVGKVNTATMRRGRDDYDAE